MSIKHNDDGKGRKRLVRRQNDAALMIKNGRRTTPDRLPAAAGTFLPDPLPAPPEPLRAAKGDDDLMSQPPEPGAPKGKPLPQVVPSK